MNNWENKYNLKILFPLIFECDFPQSILFKEYRDDIIINYAQNIGSQLQNKGSNNVLYENEEIFSILEKQYLDIISYYFEVPPLKKNLELWTYIQTRSNSINKFHNHHLKSDISTTCYLGIPKEGGELRFYIEGKTLSIKPKLNKLYIFPSWLYHQPTPHKDNIVRICINVDFLFGTRPKVKIPIEKFGEYENYIRRGIHNNEFLW